MPKKPSSSDDAERETRRQTFDEFSLARAKAINAYAHYERHLGMLFWTLLGADRAKTHVVFASVLNSQARLRMIERLLHISVGKKYDKFFGSLTQKLMGLDTVRNRIIHWTAVGFRSGGKSFDPKKDACLIEPPHSFSQRKMYKHEIDDFARRTDFYRRLVFYFAMHLRDVADGIDMEINVAGKRPWREIFLEEVSYPPAADHPLFRPHIEY